MSLQIQKGSSQKMFTTVGQVNVAVFMGQRLVGLDMTSIRSSQERLI